MNQLLELAIAKSFPPILMSKLKTMLHEGFELCLIGGASREYLSRNSFPLDLDFEMRIKNMSDFDPGNILKYLSKNFDSCEEKDFSVFRVDHVELNQKFQLEFSLPRLELYESNEEAVQPYGHSDFKVFVSNQLSYKESFARRDFTLNAIGLELVLENESMNFKIHDPYLGILDLKEKKLKNINEEFFKDPVRLLRLLRFKLQLNLMVDDSLLKDLSNFNLEKITFHYFFKEGFKVNVLEFINDFFDLVGKYSIKIPLSFHKIKIFIKLKGLIPMTINDRNQLGYLLAIGEKKGIVKWPSEEKKDMETILMLKHGTIDKYLQCLNFNFYLDEFMNLENKIKLNLNQRNLFHTEEFKNFVNLIRNFKRNPDLYEQHWIWGQVSIDQINFFKKISAVFYSKEIALEIQDENLGADTENFKLLRVFKALNMFPSFSNLA